MKRLALGWRELPAIMIPWVLLGLTLPGAVRASVPLAPSVPATSQEATELAPPADLTAAQSRVPDPDLSAMEEAARQKVRLAQATIAQAVATGSLSPPELADGFGFLGQLYHSYKLLDAAEQCYGEARALAPNDYRWTYLQGLVRFAKGDLERSAEDFEAALGLQADDVPSLLRLGNALIELNRGAEAAARFERAMELSADLAAAQYGLGKVEAMAGNDERAVELFERALELQPEASIVHYPLGQSYRRLGNREAAVEHLRQRGQEEVAFDDPLGRQVSRLGMGTAFEVLIDMAGDVEGSSERDFLGFALGQFGEVQGVVEQLEEWLARRELVNEPTDSLRRARVHYVVGGLLVLRQKDEAALGHLRQALALAPELEDARIKLGNALARGGNFDEALAEYDQVLASDPDGVEARLKRAAALMQLERWEEAQVDLERLIVVAPERIEVRARYGAVLERLGDPGAALDHYRQALDLDLGSTERLQLTIKVAQLETARGRVEEALSAYREALALNESYLPAVSGLGGLLGALNRFDEALPLFLRWQVLEPKNPRPRLAEATAQILNRDYAGATSSLESAILAFPEVLDFQDVLARHLAACPDVDERNGQRALTLARKVFDQLPTPQSAETLAMAYAEAGLFTEAVDWQERLIEQAREEASAEDTARLEGNLERYQQGLPCCGGPASN